MADPLYELLAPYFDTPSPRPPPPTSPTTTSYLSRLPTLPLTSLTTTEPASLTQTSHSLLLTLQSLSSRAHTPIIASATHLSTLPTTLPLLFQSTTSLLSALPKLDEAAIHFSETYNARATNPLLDRRREALLLSRNIERMADMLDLPSLLSSAISSSSTGGTLNYASALDLNAHIRRLHKLYPESPLVTAVSIQADDAMKDMATNLIASLRSSNLKLSNAIRTISWLRRVAPELDSTGKTSYTPGEGSLGALFLVCRLGNLEAMLGALEPLRELADVEMGGTGKGLQTERYLKRYIEIFREQSFAIISMFRSIFPPAQPGTQDKTTEEDPLQPLPSALSTFSLQLVGMLEQTLRKYLPQVRERSSRDSLLTQVLYCAASLGRLGGDFGMLLAFLQEDEDDESENEEWVEVVRKHRVLAGRLEVMVGAREG